MTASDREKWDAKYAQATLSAGLVPDDWLVACCRNLPPGRALDVACGLGHNAVWLATQGWCVDAVDVSPRGIALATALAERQGAKVNWICADLDEWLPQPGAYALVCVFRYLDRNRLPGLLTGALTPGGHLCYETFTTGQFSRADNPLRDRRFALQPGELATLYADLGILSCGEIELSDRAVGRLLARKR